MIYGIIKKRRHPLPPKITINGQVRYRKQGFTELEYYFDNKLQAEFTANKLSRKDSNSAYRFTAFRVPEEREQLIPQEKILSNYYEYLAIQKKEQLKTEEQFTDNSSEPTM